MFISCIQTNPQDNMEKNIATAFDLVSTAASAGSKFVLLPEMFTYMGEESVRKKTKGHLKSGLFLKLSNLARELKITLIAGSHSEAVPGNENKVYNTCVTFDSNGEIISVYRKLHLFNLKDVNGNPIYCESDSFEVGEPPVPYMIHDKETNETWNALNIICYDIRFPEVIRHNKQSADIVFIPAAFTWQTGKDHWEVLLRARAIENQCFVVACNQTGFHTDGKKRNYGHSMVIDPWGNVIAKLGEECGILNCILDKTLIKESRIRLSALGDRKL